MKKTTTKNLIKADDLQPLNRDVQALALEMQSLAIMSAQDYQDAAARALELKVVRNRVEDFFRPHMDALNAAIKSAREMKARLVRPLDQAEAMIKGKLARWNEQERRRAAEEAAERVRMLKELDEATRLAQADAMETAGDLEGAAAILDAPPAALPTLTVLPDAAPGVSYRLNWSAEVTDLMALVKAVAAGAAPITFLAPNTATLNATARALKESFSFPGVRAVSETVTVLKTAGGGE